jgi:putative hydrolase of the HAD superfamily
MSEAGPQHYPMADWPEVRAMDDAGCVVETLVQRYTLAVCTNASVSRRADIERALDRVGLASYFREIFCHTELGSRKEDARFWSAVLERLGAKPDETVMIGDSLGPDVLAPLRSGIAAVWFNWKREPIPAVVGFPVVHRLPDLLSLLAVPRVDAS